jgi:hypothetical protein
MSLPGLTGQSVLTAGGYWIARSSRAMTAKRVTMSEDAPGAIQMNRVTLFE